MEPGRYFHITAQSQHQIDDDLSAAAESTRAHAASEGWMGVLVTRHGPDTYTVALSASVPYGVTLKRDTGELTGDALVP
ncbi:hypothetical protein ABIB51_003792 [Arthrobacter sp. UYCu712]